ncbi:uncharacterized protein LOC109609607 isoform X2 [Aethina tumida]|uniref:uncharacterized protein LOC109609607 isoform X2 n=1 Tax=Aethina tumida TaxID=116153 RepID=UPI002148CF05|nr:uncharacterized protein LOC109609607 isoform X2 [Aethina tumida]
MSDDGLSDYFEEPSMEIQIKTLMGTSFDMKVSSTDTIGDIKRKIFRVEGIPIYQQNLIFQSKELKDTFRICDAGIRNGSTISLVVSMRGGPISTRRLSVACDHHLVLKELKELLESTREELGEKLSPGSKVSVLVFKEGDIINLLRVIENEDGSYSPYSEKPISPPAKRHRHYHHHRHHHHSKDHNHHHHHQQSQPCSSGIRSRVSGVFDRLAEDETMSNKIDSLRKKMEELNLKKQMRTAKPAKSATTNDDQTPSKSNPKSDTNSSSSTVTTGLKEAEKEQKDVDELEAIMFGEIAAVDLSQANKKFKFLNECAAKMLDDVDLTIFEKSFEEDVSETEEIALKDKHRTKARLAKQPLKKSLYSESGGELSHSRQNYARIHKKTKELRLGGVGDGRTRERRPTTPPLSLDATAKPFEPQPSLTLPTDEKTLEEGDEMKLPPFGESLTVSARNRVHLTRLVLSDGVERPKSSPDSIELEENAQDLWEIHEPATERLKHSATCKVGGLLKQRRQSVDYGFTEGLDNPTNVNNGIDYCKNSSDFEVCSGYNYHMPPFVSSPSAIPPQYAPKDQGLCDYYFSSNRSPLYGRKSKTTSGGQEDVHHVPGGPLPELNNDKFNFLGECSSIQRLKNDEFSDRCTTETAGDKPTQEQKDEKEAVKLPPVVKKKSRCGECNKKLNITNIYNCRCGKIFCSQHRYSEVHRCSYDYKMEGKKILEQQNPRVTAEKVSRI